MAIIQISKIQQRSGNLVDLPQLSEAQLGWANDARRLFIGTTTPNPNENVEVLTSYSDISFSQINGSDGSNLNISNAQTGEILGYDGNNWVNTGGDAGGLINLGAVANVKISGGTNGYVLQTDGLGNLSWVTQTGGGGGSGVPGGANTQIQFNDGTGNFSGNSGFTFNYLTGAMDVPGALTSLGNVSAPRLISTIATGTAPLTVTSTTQVANLNVATSGTVTTAAQPNITSVGTLTSLAVTGNVTAGNVYANSGIIGATNLTGTLTTAAQPNITSVGTLTTLTVSGQITNGNLTTGSNSTAGIITGNWSLSTGSKLTATYADLAEYYEADSHYGPGTVLAFGGDKEVTIAEDGTSRVAGVVSTNPAYAMNANCKGVATAIALQGRVPTKVRGTIQKGDMMVSGGNGFARPCLTPLMGTVIGKALENFDGIEGVIEIAVGRL